MFKATVLLGDYPPNGDETFYGRQPSKMLSLSKRRDAKVKSIVRLLKQQGMAAQVEYDANADGQPIAVITGVKP